MRRVRFEFGHDFELMPVVLQESRLEERSHQKKKHGQVSGPLWAIRSIHPFTLQQPCKEVLAQSKGSRKQGIQLPFPSTHPVPPLSPLHVRR
jgi:hypothetical protein